MTRTARPSAVAKSRSAVIGLGSGATAPKLGRQDLFEPPRSFPRQFPCKTAPQSPQPAKRAEASLDRAAIAAVAPSLVSRLVAVVCVLCCSAFFAILMWIAPGNLQIVGMCFIY